MESPAGRRIPPLPALRRAARAWLAVGCWGAVLVVAPLAGWAASPEAVQLNETGIARTRDGRYEEAAALFGRALELAPDDALIRHNLARVRTALGHRLLGAGQIGPAQQQYRLALEAVPDEAAALLGLGETQLRDRDPAAARLSFQRAVAREPGDPAGYRGLGDAYLQQGDAAAALAEWERALALRPGDAALRARIERAAREARVREGYRARGSQHFTAVYDGARDEALGTRLLEVLERAYADVGYALGGYPSQEVRVVFYGGADFVAATGVSAGVGGYYHPLDGTVRIATRGLRADDPQLAPVVYHEYAHALVHALTRGNDPPRWAHEGLAIYAEGERAQRVRAEAAAAARAGRAPGLEESPYVAGGAAIAALIERHGIGSVQALLRRLAEGHRFPAAFAKTFGRDVATFQRELQELLVRGF